MHFMQTWISVSRNNLTQLKPNPLKPRLPDSRATLADLLVQLELTLCRYRRVVGSVTSRVSVASDRQTDVQLAPAITSYSATAARRPVPTGTFPTLVVARAAGACSFTKIKSPPSCI